MTITPAILAPSLEHVTHKLFMLEGVTEWVQIDICDGIFGLEKTWLPGKEDHLPHGFSYEFDCMVKDWRKYIPRALTLGAKRVVVHVDELSPGDLLEVISIMKPHFAYLGLASSNDYDIDDFIDKILFVEKHYTKIFIQVMGIARIGAQGQPFDERVLKRIAYLRKDCRNIDIQVDGSMNHETIFEVMQRGARCAIVGSYLSSQGDNHKAIKKTLDKLRQDFR